MVRFRGVDVELQIGPVDPATAQAVVESVAARLAAVAAAPTGPPEFGYNSPVFPVASINPCAVSTAADFRAVFGTDAGPSVTELIPPGIGRTRFTDGLQANYVQRVCTRRAPGPTGERDQITVRATTYDATAAAAAQLAFIRATDGATDTAARVGEESVFGMRFGDPTITFRVGRALIELSLYEASRPPTADAYRALLPAATAIARRVAA